MAILKVSSPRFTISGLPYYVTLECDTCHREFHRETNAPDGGQVQHCVSCHTPEIIARYNIKYTRGT